LKYQLAQNSRHGEVICLDATLDIIHIANKPLQDMGEKRDNKEAMRIELSMGGVARIGGQEVTMFPWPHLPQCPQRPHLFLFLEP
jgi:hypothetical protein